MKTLDGHIIPCRIRGCTQEAVHRKRKLCQLHLEGDPKDAKRGGSGTKTGKCHWYTCPRKAVAPVTDGLCHVHHPKYKGQNVEKLVMATAAAGGDVKQAMAEVGYTGTPAQANGQIATLTKDATFQDRIRELALRVGLSEEDAFKAIKRGLEAQIKGLYRGEVKDLGADHAEQRANAELLFKLMTGFAPQRTESTTKALNLHVGAFIPEHKPLPMDAEIIDDGEAAE